MDALHNKAAFFLFVENVGCSVLPNEMYNDVFFHCLISECTFRSKQVSQFCAHFKDHQQEKWSRFCNECNSIIDSKKDDLLHELLHFSIQHYHRAKFQSWEDNNKLPTLIDALNSARKQRKELTSASSTETEISLSTSIELNISTVERLTTRNLQDKKHSSEQLIDRSDTIDTIDSTFSESGSISDQQSAISEHTNDDSISLVEVAQKIKVVVPDDEYKDVRKPAKKKAATPVIRSTFVIRNVELDKSNVDSSSDSIVRNVELDKSNVDSSSDSIARNVKLNKSNVNLSSDSIARNVELDKSNADSSSGSIKLSECIIYKCWYCPVNSNNRKEIYNHWKEAKEGHTDHEFMFTIEKAFKCSYCRIHNTYRELKRHSEQKHMGNTFAMVDNLDPTRCGLGCGIFGNAEDHFRENHREHNVDTSIKISVDLTNDLLDRVIKDISVLQKHTTNDNSQIKFRCSQCPVTKYHESEIVPHIREHFIEFGCNFNGCEQRFQKESLLKQHIKSMQHSSLDNSDDEPYPNIDVMKNLEKYKEMQIIFPNGLVLTKGECEKNVYGRVDDIIDVVRQIDERDLEARKRNRKEQNKETVSGSSTKPKRKAVGKNKHAVKVMR